MPAPISADWPAIRDTAVALQSIKLAAEKHGVPYPAARTRASREAWPVGRRISLALSTAKAAHAQAIQKANPKAVTSATSTSDALVEALSEDNMETRISLSRGIRKAAETIGKYKGTTILSNARKVKDIVSSAAQVHGWEAKQGTGAVTLNQLTIGRVIVQRAQDAIDV